MAQVSLVFTESPQEVSCADAVCSRIKKRYGDVFRIEKRADLIKGGDERRIEISVHGVLIKNCEAMSEFLKSLVKEFRLRKNIEQAAEVAICH